MYCLSLGFFVQSLLNEELKRSMEVLFKVAILHNWHWHHCIDGLWKVLMKHLFQGHSVLALKHIFELHKRV
jgi:hypothetical protein